MHEFNPFSTNKPKFLDILGFSDFNLDKDNKTLDLKFNASVDLTHSNDTIVQGGFVTAMLDSCMAQLVLALTNGQVNQLTFCLLYTSPSPRDKTVSRMPSSA